MAFSWMLAVSFSFVIICLIIWAVIATKKQAFTFKEIGAVTTSQNNNHDVEVELVDTEVDVLLSSPYLSITTLSIFRGFIGMFCLVVFIINNSQGPTNGLHPMTFYTMWQWTLLTIYFISLSMIGLLTAYNKMYMCISNQRVLNNLRILIWIIFECLCSMVLLTDLMVWFFADNPEQDKFTSIIMHSVNFILIYLELIINNVPLPNIHHSIFAIILGQFYNIFVWTIFAIVQRPFPYPNLDYTKDINALLTIIVNIVLFISWLIAYGFKRIIVHRLIRKNADYMQNYELFSG